MYIFSSKRLLERVMIESEREGSGGGTGGGRSFRGLGLWEFSENFRENLVKGTFLRVSWTWRGRNRTKTFLLSILLFMYRGYAVWISNSGPVDFGIFVEWEEQDKNVFLNHLAFLFLITGTFYLFLSFSIFFFSLVQRLIRCWRVHEIHVLDFLADAHGIHENHV